MKWLVYIICYCIYPFSFILPRTKKKWAFGCSHYAFADNSKYFFIYASEHSDVDCAWLTFNSSIVRQIRSMGLKAYNLASPQGVWHALRSKNWFYNSYVSDILFCLSGKATRINLWHGVPLKQIEFDVTSGPLTERYVKQTFKEKFYHPESFARPDYIFAPSDRFVQIFSSAFRVKTENCLKYGIVPRNRLLVINDGELSQFINKYESKYMIDLVELTKQYDCTYIYMPTWRETQRNIFTQSMDLGRLNEILKKRNALLLLKPHLNTKVNAKKMGEYTNVKLIDSKADVYPLLPHTDVLITDYSSIMYDYMLMKDKNILLYLYDYEDYMKNERDFYFPFDENTIGTRAYSFEELTSCLSQDLPSLDTRKRDQLLTTFWGDHIDDKANDLLIEKFKD